MNTAVATLSSFPALPRPPHSRARPVGDSSCSSRITVMKLFGAVFLCAAYGLWASNAAAFQPEPVPSPDSVLNTGNECNEYAFGSVWRSSTSVSSMSHKWIFLLGFVILEPEPLV